MGSNRLVNEAIQMKDRITDILIGLFLGIIFFSSIALADTSTMKQISPDINITADPYAEYYTLTPFILNITNQTTLGAVDNNAGNVTAYLYNSTSVVTFVLKNGSADASWYVNQTPVNFTLTGLESNGDRFRNLTYKITHRNGTDLGWFNSSFENNFTKFKINEVVGNVSFTSGTYSNNTVYKIMQVVNTTTNRTVAGMVAYVRGQNQNGTADNPFVAETSYTLVNSSGVRTRYVNNSAVTLLNNTLFGSTNNSYITLRAEDAYGNYSWKNTTRFNATDKGGWSDSGQIFFKIDTLPPVITSEGITILNQTAGGQYINFTVWIKDNTTNLESNTAVWLYTIQDDGRSSNITGTLSHAINRTRDENTSWRVLVNASDLKITGNFTFVVYANDSVNNIRNSTTVNERQIYVFDAGWNLAELYQNITLSQVADLFPSHAQITYVSLYNNLPTWKNYTTWTNGLGANAGVRLNSTQNSTYIYVNRSTAVITSYTPLDEASAQWMNVSLYTNGWNLMSPIKRATINQTLYMCSIPIGFGNGTCNSTAYNVTDSSFYNSTLAQFCTGYRGYLPTSCIGYNVTRTTIPRGVPVWIRVDVNSTEAVRYNRTSY